jgi:hypothetical protein
MNKEYLTAVIICKMDEPIWPGTDTIGFKYHDIRNTAVKIQTFLKFAATKKGAVYVNFYFKTTHKSEKGRNFYYRAYVNQ